MTDTKRGTMWYIKYNVSLVVVLSLVARNGQVEAATGLRITVAEKTLQMVNQAEVSALQRDLDGEKIGVFTGSNGGGLSWTISNTHVKDVGSMPTTINLYSNGQITWRCSVSTVTVEADWRATQNTWFGPWSDSGSVEAKAGATSLEITLTLSANSGGLGISLGSCSAKVGRFDLDFSGSWLSWLYNFLSDMFEGSIRSTLQNSICYLVSEGMDDITGDMRNITTSFPIEVIGIPLILDNAFTKVKVTSDTISTYHEGAVHWNGLTFHSTDKSAFPVARPSRGIAFDLSEDVVNSLLRAYVDSGNLDGSFNYSRVTQEGWDEFYLTCKKESKNSYCFGNIIRQVATEYPDRVLGMQWSVHSANLNIQNGQITGELTGRVNCSADSVSESLLLFSAEVALDVAFQMKFSEGELSARTVAWGGNAIIDRSNIGKVVSPKGLEAIHKFLLPGIQQRVLDMLNEFKTHYKLELPQNVLIRSSGLNFYEGVVRVEADLCYKTKYCQTTPNDKWAGNKNILKFTVDDVIPTTTTTTTTMRPTNKKQRGGNETSGQALALLSAINLFICLAFGTVTVRSF